MIPFEVEEKQSRVATLARAEENAQERLLLTSEEVKKLQPFVEGVDGSGAAFGGRVIPGRGSD
jgi:hypothetical protein